MSRNRVTMVLGLALAIVVGFVVGGDGTAALAQPEPGPLLPQSYFPITLRGRIAGSGSLELIGTIPLDYESGITPLTRAVALRGDLAYVGMFDRRSFEAWLEVFDISVPSRISRVGRSEAIGYLDGSWDGMPLELAGDVAFAAASTAGLRIIDLSDPIRPRWIGHLALAGDAAGISIDGQRAVLIEGLRSDIEGRGADAHIHLLDIGNPLEPRIIGSLVESKIKHSFSIALSGARAFVPAHRSGLLAFDVGDPAKITLIEEVEPLLVRDLALAGDSLLTIRWGGSTGAEYGLWSYDRTASDGLRLLDRLTPSHGDGFAYPEHLVLEDGWAYVVETGGSPDYVAPATLYAVDARDPSNLRLNARVRAPGGVTTWDATGIDAKNGFVMVTSFEGIFLYRHHTH